MAGFGESGFNANDPAFKEANLIPKGNYKVALVESDVKVSTDGATETFYGTFQILEGEFANRKISDRFAFKTTSTEPGKLMNVKIGGGRLSEFSRSLNILNPKDSLELHDKPVLAYVSISKERPGYPSRNEITGFKPAGRGAVTPAPSPAPAVAPQAAGSNSEVWG